MLLRQLHGKLISLRSLDLVRLDVEDVVSIPPLSHKNKTFI